MASARGDGHALLLSAGQLFGIGVTLGREPDLVEQVHGEGLRFGGRDLGDLDRPHGHVLEDGEVREQVETLEHHPDPGALPRQGAVVGFDEAVPATLLADGLAVDEDAPARRFLDEVHAAQHGGLPRAGRPDDGHFLARADVEVDAGQHVELSEGFVQPLDPNEGHGRGRWRRA